MIKSLYPVFQHWSKTGSVWLFSDPHFDDSDTKVMNPNWIEPDEQIKILKECCPKNDTLILLGDIGNPEYIRQLKCYKVLISGNHDYGLSKYESYFDEMYGGPLFISDRIVLSHERLPYMPYALNIHGHHHNGHNSDNYYSVCADVVDYTPVNLGKLIKSGILSKIPTIHRYTIDKEDRDG